MNKSKKVLNKLGKRLIDHEQEMKKQVIKMSCSKTSHEQVVNKSWGRYEQIMNE